MRPGVLWPLGLPPIRYETRYEIGEPGAVYEFNVKLLPFESSIDDTDFEFERDNALEGFGSWLRSRYKWVGSMHFTGRSGGWLAIVDKKGGATEKALLAIADAVAKEKRHFVRYLEKEYPR